MKCGSLYRNNIEIPTNSELICSDEKLNEIL